MNGKIAQTIPNLFPFSGRKPSIFALLLAFCILTNSFCPRAVIELKNYDVVVLAMGSQSVFLHLFALPSKVSIELANMLFNDKIHPCHAKNSNNKTKNTSNSSADFSILNAGQGQSLEKLQSGICQAVVFTGSMGVGFFTSPLRIAALAQMPGIAYFLFMLLFFSRPRGQTQITVSNIFMMNISKLGLSLIPGFSFGGLTPIKSSEVCYELAN